MNYQTALEVLGLGPGAGPERVVASYRELAAPLKRTLLNSTGAERKRAARDALRKLVCAREVARGRPPPANWRGKSVGISTETLCTQLADCDPLFLDPTAARQLFGLEPDCTADQVHDAFLVRRRALMRRFARSTIKAEMDAIRDYAARLRLVRDLAMPAVKETPVFEESEELVPPEASEPSLLTESESVEATLEELGPPSLWEDELSSLPSSGETISIQVAFPAEESIGLEVEALVVDEPVPEEPAEPEEPELPEDSEPEEPPKVVELWFDDETDGEPNRFDETLGEIGDLAALDEFVKAHR